MLGVFSIFFSIQAFTQKPGYDSVLEKKLGADDYGMRSYIFVILKTGAVKNADKKTNDSLFAGHMKNIGRLAQEGKLVLAGPFGKNPKAYRGLFILNVKTIEEAKHLVATDPAVSGKLLAAEYYNWYGSAAVMAIPEMQEKVQKTSF